MSNPGARCHACGAAWEGRGPPGFKAYCESCQAELHVCLNCELHDPKRHNECRDPTSEWVKHRDRANTCEEFGWKRPETWARKEKPGGSRALDALLDPLLGDADGSRPQKKTSIDDLFS